MRLKCSAGTTQCGWHGAHSKTVLGSGPFCVKCVSAPPKQVSALVGVVLTGHPAKTLCQIQCRHHTRLWHFYVKLCYNNFFYISIIYLYITYCMTFCMKLLITHYTFSWLVIFFPKYYTMTVFRVNTLYIRPWLLKWLFMFVCFYIYDPIFHEITLYIILCRFSWLDDLFPCDFFSRSDSIYRNMQFFMTLDDFFQESFRHTKNELFLPWNYSIYHIITVFMTFDFFFTSIFSWKFSTYMYYTMTFFHKFFWHIKNDFFAMTFDYFFDITFPGKFSTYYTVTFFLWRFSPY